MRCLVRMPELSFKNLLSGWKHMKEHTYLTRVTALLRRRVSILLLLLSLLIISNTSLGQNIDVDMSAGKGIFNVLASMKKGAPQEKVSSMLDSVLQTKPYQAMFRHYNRSWRPNHLPPSVFKRMILSLKFQNVYSEGENERADQMLPFWKKFYSDLDLFRRNIRQLEKADLKKLIRRSVAFAQSWLPPEWHIPDFYVPIHPNGGSRAFAIETIQGYDFFQLPRDDKGNILLENLLLTISHESHHLGVNSSSSSSSQLGSFNSPAYSFLSLFIGEGTATKFINNYPGGCVPVIDKSRDASFDTPEVGQWWQKHSAAETELFKRFVETFERANSGQLSAKDLQNEIGQFWLAGYVSPVYFVGSELFGAIYLGYGKQGVFVAMQDPRLIPLMYNNAIKSKPDLLGSCYKIPDSTVKHALAIDK